MSFKNKKKMIKSFKEHQNISEKRIITKHDMENVISQLNLTVYSKDLNVELTDAIVKAITPILKKHGYTINI